MIYVDRSPFPAPIELLEFQKRSLASLRAFFATDIVDRAVRWPRFDFPPRVADAVRYQLQRMFNDRCAYCGALATAVDHYRPRRNAGRADHDVDTDRYWWLSAEWSNLYLCCRSCNIAKANLFPIDGPAADPETFGDALLAERPVLLDPCRDRPEEHLEYHADGTVSGLSPRGSATIALLQLNSNAKVGSRRHTGLLLRYQLARLQERGIDAAGQLEFLADERINEALSAGRPEAQAAIRALMAEISGQPQAATAPVGADAGAVLDPSAMAWLDRIEIRNFRSIGALDLSFQRIAEENQDGGQPWMMLLGENGVGKTSLLQAVALGCMPDNQLHELGPAHRWLSRNDDVQEGFIRLTFTNGTQRRVSFQKGSARFSAEGEACAVRLLAYGSTRLLPAWSEAMPAPPGRCSVRNLFDQRHPLVNAEAYFCAASQTSRKDFELIASSVEALLPDPGDAKLARRGNAMWREHLPLDALSGGYKSMIALAMDIMFHLSVNSYDMESARGLVLLDEIELHLHPRWKIRIVSQLRNLFPNVRFIASTHDPLCVQGLQKGELVVLATNPYSGTFVHQEIDVPHGSGADRVLTGPWFGMTSTLDRDTLRLIEQHSKLLQNADRDDAQQYELDTLQSELAARMCAFNAPQVHAAADHATEASRANVGAGAKHSVSSDALRRRLLDILEDPAEDERDDHA
jgi:uncharacterized protein (TIGR02646 family)